MPIAGATSEMKLECVEACDLCGGRTFRPRRAWKDPLLFGSETWNLVECETCALHFISPRPARCSIGRFYPDDYGTYTACPTPPKKWHRRVATRDAAPLAWWERPLIHVRQNVSWYRFPTWTGEGHVLDIGCGSGGRFLDPLKGIGWTTYGMDPSPIAIKAAKDRGHEALVGFAEDQAFPDRTMDVVTMWHVLEHTHAPMKALAATHRVLKPGGLLNLCVPNWGSLQAALYGRFWWSCDAPRHLFQFTKPTLRRYLEEAGFKVQSMTTRSGATSYQRAARHLLNAVFRKRYDKDASWLVSLADPWVAIASLFRFAGVGAEIRVIAEKT